MFKYLRWMFPLAVVLLAGSCATRAEIEDINSQIDKLYERVSTVEQQATAINKTVSLLEDAYELLGKSINDMEGEPEALMEELKTLKSQLAQRIEDLKTYADTQDASNAEWIKVTFATIDQYEQTSTLINQIQLSANSTASNVSDLSDKLNKAHEKMQAWVSSLMDDYYKVGEINALLASMKAGYEAADVLLQDNIDKYDAEISLLSENIAVIYKKAFADAITQNEGYINGIIESQLTTKLANIKSNVEFLTSDITQIETAVRKLSLRINAIKITLSSVTVLPEYSDCSIDIFQARKSLVRVQVLPAHYGDLIDDVKAFVINMDTQVSTEIPAEAPACADGILSINVDGRDLSEDFFSGNQNLFLRISVGGISSSYIAVNPVKLPNGVVDLGLSDGTLWNDTNLSETDEFAALYEAGGYYAWGELTPKASGTQYSWVTYKHCSGSSSTLTKYNNVKMLGTVDNKTRLDAEDDAVSSYRSGTYPSHIPTAAEWQTLIDECTWTWTSQVIRVSGKLTTVYGYDVTGPNGNTMFLIGAGHVTGTQNRTILYNAGYYWSSDLDSSAPLSAKCLTFSQNNIALGTNSRCYGLLIRPVYVDKITPTITMTKSMSFREGAEARNLGARTTSGTAITYVSSDTSVATVDEDGNVTPVAKGSCTVTATSAADASFNSVSATCEVKVRSNVEAPGAVDLGLPSGTQWATTSLGATATGVPGLIFAWGETETKTTYTLRNYKYMDTPDNGIHWGLTKYCPDKDWSCGWEYSDLKTELDPDDDAATAILGEDWCIPSVEQCKELLLYTEKSWDETMQAMKLTSQFNGRVLYIGNKNEVYDDRDVYGSSEMATIWTRDLDVEYPMNAFAFELYQFVTDDFTLTTGCVSSKYRPYGIQVVPVLAN